MTTMGADDSERWESHMTSGPEPTGWELLRSVDGLRGAMVRGFDKIDERLADGFIPRSEGDAIHKGLADDIDDLKARNRDQDAFRRAIVIALVVVFATAMSGLITALVHVHG